jgi:uncharacterized protein YndB with AHSA1/START domain
MTHYQPSPLATVSTESTEDRYALVFVREFRHPPHVVWTALTEPGQLERWAPFTAERDLSLTGETTLTMFDGDESLDLAANVIRSEPPTLLEYTWGTDLLRWQLEPIDTGTRLTLRHVVESREMVSMVAAGWHMCFDVAEHLLDGDPIEPIRGQDARNHGWDDLHKAYEEKLS